VAVQARSSDARKHSKSYGEVQLPRREKNQLMFKKIRARKYTKALSEVYTKVNQPKSIKKKEFASGKYI
jgi:hypothetical protein